MHELALYLVVGTLGTLIGSFLNVCIFRLPRGESIVWPGSHCPSCAHPIEVYDNIPLLSYLWLAGRCRACRTPIPIRYPLVEATNAIGYLAILWFFGPSWTAVLYALLFSGLVVVTGTDLTHKMIPNVITLPGILVGLLGAVTVALLGFACRDNDNQARNPRATPVERGSENSGTGGGASTGGAENVNPHTMGGMGPASNEPRKDQSVGQGSSVGSQPSLQDESSSEKEQPQGASGTNQPR